MTSKWRQCYSLAPVNEKQYRVSLPLEKGRIMKDVKKRIQAIIQDIEDDPFLEAVYEVLESRRNQKSGTIWHTLTSEQQEEILKAAEETNQPEKQISHDEMVERNRKWLEP